MMGNKKERWLKAQRREILHYLSHKTEWTENKWKNFIEQNFKMDVKNLKYGKILEIGCGMSGPILFLNLDDAYGLDPLIIDYHRIGMIPNTQTTLVNGIGEYLPFKNNVFDIILCFNVLDHVIEPEKVLKEIRRIAKNRAKVLIWVHVFNIPKIIRPIVNIIDSTHPFHFSMQELIQLLFNVGFKVKFVNKNNNINKKILVELIKGKKFKRFIKFLGGILLGLSNVFIICEVDDNEK